MFRANCHSATLLTAVVCWLVAVFIPPAWAKPPYKETLGRFYGAELDPSLKQCATCHVVPLGMSEAEFAEGDGPHNVFGQRLAAIGRELAAEGRVADLASRLEKIAEEDTDGDGVPNELELLAGTAPGDREDVPAAVQLALAAERQHAIRDRYRWEPWHPVTRPGVPAVTRDDWVRTPIDWVRTPIDAFIAAEHERQGVSPRPEAPRHVLLRRVYLGLIGLPPTGDELEAFLDDSSPDAYERVVDQLLDRPQYGERWGRHWMDVWRYSDWAGWGAQVRDSQPHIWRWRDWIIESLNADEPYDHMLTEMLAADELDPENPDAVRATGFLVRNYKRLSREQWMQETVDHTTKAFLGMTLECARCHDHMYDAVSQEEYYRFRAIFEPYNVRIDRVPGQVDAAQDGLARVFDADPDVVTYFYVRGDERQPDKGRSLEPGVPRELGGTFSPDAVQLPRAAWSPGTRQFVREDDLRAAVASVEEARRKQTALEEKVAQAERAAAQSDADENARSNVEAARRELALALLDLPLAESQHSALAATILVEQLEEAGVKQSDPSRWEQAAREVAVAQRAQAVIESRKLKLLAADALTQAEAERMQAEERFSIQPEDAQLKAALEKSEKSVSDAEQKYGEAVDAVQKAEEAAAAEPSTDYQRRDLPTYPQASTGRRLALARWIADTKNPLTARVAANHIWMRHIGQPLVPSVFDFGNNGQPPTHPALLDWLAAEFMEPSLSMIETDRGRAWEPLSPAAPNWTMKHLHRLIVTSSTYRMASTPDPAAAALDPDNRTLWRIAPRRMEAEVVRDCVLHLGGRLDLSRGGPDVDHVQGQHVPRRSLYFRHAPEKQMTFLRLFDAASPNECYRRKESIVPQQALALANSALAVEQSRRLARRLDRDHAANSDFVRAAFEQVLCRTPTPEELETSTAYLDRQRAFYEQNTERLTAVATTPEDVSRPAADRSLRARESLVRVLFNHHEFVTIR